MQIHLKNNSFYPDQIDSLLYLCEQKVTSDICNLNDCNDGNKIISEMQTFSHRHIVNLIKIK